MKIPASHALVAFIDDDGQLRELRIPQDTVHIARERGWMVFDDFEPQTSPQADGDDGA